MPRGWALSSASGCWTLRDRYDVVGDVRGRGLFQGIELVHGQAEQGSGRRARECGHRGLSGAGPAHEHRPAAGMGGIFRIAPPLTISEDDLHAGLDILEASLKAVLDEDAGA